jgi:glycosyltransferase involved in cell wall biosynthesis
MPVYASEKHLEQRIRSILDQTFTDFELIIINDGSTGSSPNIIESMRALDSRIIVMAQQDKGVTAAANAGLAAA